MSLSSKEDDQDNIASNNDQSHTENVPTNLPDFDPLICRLSLHESFDDDSYEYYYRRSLDVPLRKLFSLEATNKSATEM